MPVSSSNDLRADLNAHGIRPFDVILETARERSVSWFATNNGLSWVERPVRVQQVTQGYGAEPYSVVFYTWDPANVEASHVNPLGVLEVPLNGMHVALTIRDINNPGGLVFFRGTIRSVHSETDSSGTVWRCEAISEVTRLNDFNVTFTSNLRNDPINPNPYFTGTGKLVKTVLRTVQELVQEVMNFRDAFTSSEFFAYTDIDWNGYDTSPRCGKYVPSTVAFENTSKGRAIAEILQLAGNYTFIYVPERSKRGKLRVVEFNLSCTSCGDRWPVDFVNPRPVGSVVPPQYAHKHFVQEDATEWNTKDTANVVRITTAPIRFYSGNWALPEIYTGGGENAASRNLVPYEQDTTAKMDKRARSLDDTYYRFNDRHKLVHDNRVPKVFPVGLPLFPDWNIHEDHLPAMVEVASVQAPAGVTLPIPVANYGGWVEYQHYTVGDEVARGQAHLGNLDNLRVYQAWYATDDCPACNGTGLVQKVYNNADNEPAFSFFAVNAAGGERSHSPNSVLSAGERIVRRVTNYIFDPKKFGERDPTTGQLWLPIGLSAYVSGGGTYPHPAKNLCPYCRGVGMKPEYKIRNIQPDLCSGRANKVVNPSNVTEIPLDPDQTQTGPETWEDAVNRVVVREGAWLMMEDWFGGTTLPNPNHRNKAWKDIDAAPTNEQRYDFANHITYKNVKKRIPQAVGLPPTDTRSDIAPSSWTCQVPYTTVTPAAGRARIDYQMGRVIFNEPVFVPCRKKFTDYITTAGQKFLLDSAGLLKPRSLGRGTMFADRHFNPTGFWRHAKVWLTFMYNRQNYFDAMVTNPKTNQSVNTLTFTAISPEGVNETYKARTSIHDGRLVMEIYKVFPGANEADGQLFPTGYRTIQAAFSDSEAKIETSEADLWKVPLIPTVDDTDKNIEAYKRSQGCEHPRGRILKYERTTPGEIQLEVFGYVAADYNNSIMRPKPFAFPLRDDRSRLLGMAVRRLESVNNVQVSGVLKLVGLSQSFTKGLGWVDHPKGRAAVRRVTYTFGDGMFGELELAREEARVGETIPTDEQRMHNIEKDYIQMRRLWELNTALAAQGNSQMTTNNGADIPVGGQGVFVPK
jgi:hypothetical protein